MLQPCNVQGGNLGEKATLTVGGESYEFDITTGSENEKSIDIQTLRSQSGYITMDPGFGNTGSCFSDITYADGAQGILRYRGYPIEVIAEKASFVETCSLLIYGELPDAKTPQRTIFVLLDIYYHIFSPIMNSHIATFLFQSNLTFKPINHLLTSFPPASQVIPRENRY